MTTLNDRQKEAFLDSFSKSAPLYKMTKQRLFTHLIMTGSAFLITVIIFFAMGKLFNLLFAVYMIPSFIAILLQGLFRHIGMLNKIILKCSDNNLNHAQFKKLIKTDAFMGEMVAEILKSLS